VVLGHDTPELHRRACELAAATVAIRRAVADPGSTVAAPVLLDCVESALRDLAVVADRLGGADDHLQRALTDAAIAARVTHAAVSAARAAGAAGSG
jgi:hypothetical protein